jgi:hypothetical protein
MGLILALYHIAKLTNESCSSNGKSRNRRNRGSEGGKQHGNTSETSRPQSNEARSRIKRGAVFVFLLAVIVLAGDHFVVNTLKHLISRPSPLAALAALGDEGAMSAGRSMPSSHTFKWVAATLRAYVFYPKSWRVEGRWIASEMKFCMRAASEPLKRLLDLNPPSTTAKLPGARVRGKINGCRW